MIQADYSSDSDAPEEISHAKSKASAIQEFKKLNAAKASAKEKSKAKRRAEIERNIDQKKAKQLKIDENEKLESIPDDLLSAVAALKRGDISLVQGDNDDEARKRKIHKRKDNIIVNNLETESTKFSVIKLDEVDQPLVDQKKEIESIQNFKNSHFFHNSSIKRSKAWQVTARRMKRKF